MITIAAAGAMGIVAQDHFGVSIWVWLGLCGFAVAMLSVWTGVRRWSCLLVLVAATMALRWHADEAAYRAASLGLRIEAAPGPVMIRGRVTGLVHRAPKPAQAYDAADQPWQTRFDIRVDQARDGDRWIAVDGRLAVTVDDDVETVRSGDRLQISGQMSAIRPPTNPGVFDWSVAARNRRQHGRLSVETRTQVDVLERPRWSIAAQADRFSRSGERTLHACLGDDTGALAAALVVGRRQAIDAELQDQLLETGTIHLLSVSGMHMGIVALALHHLAILLGLPRASQLLFVAVCCLAFVAVTGAQPPVIRAATLVGVVLLARGSDRQDSPLNSLALAAMFLMLLNPTNLFQVGVQLSFIAVATLFSAGHRAGPIREELRVEAELDRLISETRGPLRRRWDRLAGKFGAALWFSLCVALTTTPLVWLHFHVVSPIAIVANVLLGLPLAIGLISGLAAVCLGSVSLRIATPIAWVCQASLWLIETLVGWAAQVPLGHFWLPAPPGWWVGAYYLAIALGLAGAAINRSLGRRAFVFGSLAWCSIAWILATAPARRIEPGLCASFLDVGHGTSVILSLPDGRKWLYDCGSLGNFTGSARGIQEPLWALGLTRLDAVLLSHADADHYNALPGLLRRFGVGELIIPEGMLEVPKEGLADVREAIRQSGVRVREVAREDRWIGDDRTIEILHPPRQRVAGNDNANSLVIRFEQGGRTLILPGDLEPPGMQQVLDLPRPPPGGVLMAPHHGSLTLDNRSMLDWARPREVIVSGGSRANRLEVVDVLGVRGSGVHITARDGAIRVRLSETGIEIRSWLHHPW